MEKNRSSSEQIASQETAPVQPETAYQRVERELLQYRGNESLEQSYTEISNFILEKDMGEHPELQELSDILLEKKALFSTPILLNAGNASRGEQPTLCASCYIVDADNLSIEEFINLQNSVFEGAGGVGANISASPEMSALLRAVEKNARKRYSGTPTRGCSIGLVCDADSQSINDFIETEYQEEGGSTESYRHVIRNVLMSGRFLDAARHRGSEEYSILLNIARKLLSDGTPGVLFEDRINKDQPYPIRATNPCAEFLCADNTAAMLASINIAKFVEGDSIDFTELARVARAIGLSLNVVIDSSDYPTQEIAEETKKHRPIGVSVTNVAHALSLLGLRYDSDAAREICRKIFKCVNETVDAVDGNTQTTLVAPTGRIGLLLGCESLALESNLVDQQSEISMMAAVQPYISGGISNTIEYRRLVSEEDVIADIFRSAEMGLKGYTCYVNREFALDIA